MSIRSDLHSSVSGMARSAPSGPITQAQKISDKNVTVVVRPTESPTNLGWITDWITKLIAE
ncbi:Uncharacterised protein [Mycobacteroides abscessus subsp. abscessus]|nr:Uncharacterised protein [Mycobacteroides abscessus subsp. abscessus]